MRLLIAVALLLFCVGARGDFTPILPSEDSLRIFVSDSEGSDSNDCLSEARPCKTLAAAFERVREGWPDHVYLKRGDTWRNQKLALKSGRSAHEPAVVAFYGDSGPRPRIEHHDNIVHELQLANVHLIGLYFDAYKMDPSHPEFGGGTKDDHANLVFLQDIQNVLLEDNVFDHLEIVVQHYEGGRPSNIVLRRNIFTGAYVNTSSLNRDLRPSNLYAAGVDGLLLEENVFDYGGWHPEVRGAGANMFNHNVYLQSSNNGDRVVVRNNIFTRASSHGIQMRAGGLAEDNFFGRNAIGLMIGYKEDPVVADVRAHLYRNVVSEGHSMVKGVDPCTGDHLCTAALFGIQVVRHGDGDFRAFDNVVSNRSPNDDFKGEYKSLTKIAYRAAPGAKQEELHGHYEAGNNALYLWDSDSQGTDANYLDPGRTLADYHASLGGSRSFDSFMDVVLNRPLQTWDERFTAKRINEFIRAGFEPAAVSSGAPERR